jgi:two-component system sensor histidine kinase ChvG
MASGIAARPEPSLVRGDGLLVRVASGLARIRYRLLLINVIVAAVPIVGIVFARMHEQQLLGALESDMIHQAQLVRTLQPRGAPLDVIARDTRTRIRILDAQGTVIADSHNGPPEATPVAMRPEIRRALAGKYGAATRLWRGPGPREPSYTSRDTSPAAMDLVYLFVAVPIVDNANHVTGAVYVTRSTRDVKLQLIQLRAWMFRVLLSTIAITALITLLLATTIARPLGRLTRRAQRIAARGPSAPEPADERLAARRDEIGQLARAVGAMTDELDRRARDARSLAADISHEFKTPLAGIRGAAELLRDGAADEPVARDRFLAMIEDDTQRLDRLVSRLLELARVEDDRGTPLPVDLGALADDAAARPWPARVEAAAAGVAVVPGRSAQLTSAIDNLVANACQHATPDTTVVLVIEPRADFVRVTVSNRGPALSEAARARVWDRFYSTRAASGGSGLGLAIVRSVAIAHGGTCGVACADGVTSFWFDVHR